METAAAPNEIKAWLECLLWFAGLVLVGIHIAKALKPKSGEPPNAQLADTVGQLALRMAKVETSNDKLWAKLEADKMQILNAGEERIVKVHDRINEVLAAVCELRGSVNQMTHGKHPR
jgi:hypothetical protein